MTEPWTDTDVELVTGATERHHIDFEQTDADGNNPCVCGGWWDSAEMPGWDQHMAEVAVSALAAAGRLTPADAAEHALTASDWHLLQSMVQERIRQAEADDIGPDHPSSQYRADLSRRLLWHECRARDIETPGWGRLPVPEEDTDAT